MPTHHERKDDPSANNDKGPRPEQKGYSTSEAVVALRDEITKQAKANRDKPDAKHKPNWIELGTLFLVIATTALLVIQDVILHSSDETFGRTLELQKGSNERQLRAYVGMTPGDVEDFGVSDKQRVRFIRKNFGSTPAYEVGFSTVGLSTIKIGEPINTGPGGCTTSMIPGQITMFPTVELPWIIIISGPVFTPDQIQLVKSSNRQFVYWGTICYNDTFAKPHFTNYCWMYKGSSMTARDAEACLTHNDFN